MRPEEVTEYQIEYQIEKRVRLKESYTGPENSKEAMVVGGSNRK